MGRHSAGDDDSGDGAAGVPATLATPEAAPGAARETGRGRHAHPDDDAGADGGLLGTVLPVETAEPAERGAPVEQPKPPKPPKQPKPPKPPKQPKQPKRDGETDTQADLRLLRSDAAVRARSIAAVLVSFLLYTVALIVVGRTDVYLIWLWIPIVTSGVGVGIVLDLAHRRS